MTIAFVTLGVAGFMFFEDAASTASNGKKHGGKNATASSNATHSLLGVGLLLANLLMDGSTNSIQDKIFIVHRVRSQQMMFCMNIIAFFLLLFWMLLNLWNHELTDAVNFIQKYPASLMNIVSFAFCGALGQNFIYYALEKFGSLSLVMVTVTRKLFTILISLIYFDHKLNTKQWISVLFVFAALLLESFLKNKKEQIPDFKQLKDSKISVKSE